ncbi:MAG: flavodoxin family protein [Nitrospiraceae bacterium]|jgi:NAD(P)H dehydrogenase (quinone)|nr:MAG: flavodoxin family protein [Nitrospiraceae bacterium]
MSRLIVVYHSTYGHTKLQAEAVYQGASGVDGIKAEIMTASEAIENIDILDNADAIIFGTATYMGNIASDMKKFMEASVKKWFAGAWKNKIAGGFSNSSSFSGDKLNTLQGIVVFAMQHGMIWVGTGMFPSQNNMDAMNSIEGPGPETHNRVGSFIGPMSASFQVDPPGAPSKGDIETAELYGKRVAEITLQFVKGRE